jgi:phosphatidylinositol kinase/protein kinase (PI-3  family)
MSLLFSADTDGEDSQNYEHDIQSRSLAWEILEIDENKMAALGKLIQEIANSTEKFPEMVESAKSVQETSSRIIAIIIPLCLLARITDPLLSVATKTQGGF